MEKSHKNFPEPKLKITKNGRDFCAFIAEVTSYVKKKTDQPTQTLTEKRFVEECFCGAQKRVHFQSCLGRENKV